MKPQSTIAIWFLLLPLTAFASDPGLVTVVGEQPVALPISVPSSSAYKLSYDPVRISVWDTVTKDNLIAPSAEFTASTVKGDAEPDCDIDLDDFAGFQRCFGSGPLGPGCGDFDFEPDADVDLTDFANLESNIAGPKNCVSVTVTVFVEGLTASTTLGDAEIGVLADPDGDLTFTLQSTEAVTVVSLQATPASGLIGTEITLTLQPAVTPISFDSTTTAQWEGIFQPMIGTPSSSFVIAYSTTDFRETSSSVANLIVGEGSGLPALPSTGVPLGTLCGTLSIQFPMNVVSISFDFQFPSSALEWVPIIYPEDASGFLDQPPMLGSTPHIEIPIYAIPEGGANPAYLDTAYFYHTACVIRLDENAITSTEAPAMLTLDLVTFDSANVEIGRIEDVDLVLNTNDGDPNRLTYSLPLGKPIVFVEGTIEPSNFPGQFILQAAEDGIAVAIEGAS